jgi:PAS domain S-box-containing protein
MPARLGELLRRARTFQGLPADFLAALEALGDPTTEEDQLVQIQAQHLKIFEDTTPLFLAYIRKDGCFEFVSKNYADFFGKTPEELHRRPLREIFPPELMAANQPYVDRVLRGESVVYLDAVGPPGAEREFQVHLVPQPDHRGETLAYIAMIFEITEQRRGERERRLTEQRLTEELRAALAEARAASEAKDRFLAGMSHDLRTPLHTILQAAEHTLDGPLDSTQRGSIEELRRQTLALRDTLKDILELAWVRKDPTVRPPPPRPQVEEKPPPEAKRPVVLLVEDNRINQIFARKCLEKFDLEVLAASSGAEAVRFFEERAVDLVLMDLAMPGMDGFETTTALRKHQAERGYVPVAALTANGDEQVRRRCQEIGMSGFLAKPFSPNQLEQLVRQFLPLTRR